MIKRSIVGILVAVGMLASACSPRPQPVAISQVQQVQTPEPKLYNSVQDCQTDPTNVNPQLCATAFAQSQAQLTHYNSYAACSNYGYDDCVDHGGWFGPMMTGFMLGAMSNGYYGSPVYVLHGGYYGGGYYGHSLNYGSPVRGVGGHYILSHDVVVHHNVYVAQHSTTAPSAVVSRGGFGSSATVSRPYVAAPSSAATVQRGGFGGGFGGATTANSGYHAASSYHASSYTSSYRSSSSGSSRRR